MFLEPLWLIANKGIYLYHWREFRNLNSLMMILEKSRCDEAKTTLSDIHLIFVNQNQ